MSNQRFSLTNLLRNMTLGDLINIVSIIAPLLVNPKPKEEAKTLIVNNYYCYRPFYNTGLQLLRINKICLL
jgi:hypothetical protein